MKKTLQSPLSLLFSVILCLSFFPVTGASAEGSGDDMLMAELGSSADDGVQQNEDRNVTVSDGQYEVFAANAGGNIGPFEWVNLRWKLNAIGTLTVYGSGDMPASGVPWSSYKDSIKEVVLESGVTSICNNAFRDCKNLEYITIAASSLNYLGTWAFANCSSLKQIRIPSGITDIGAYTFYRCRNLKSVTLPSGVTSIGEEAFYECEALESFTMPDSMTSIASYAFYSCRSLPSITIPSGVEDIEIYTFNGCNSLTSLTFQEGVKNIGNFSFASCNSLTDVTIPSSVTNIDNCAFANCESLAEIRFLGVKPSISNGTFAAFINVTADAYYPADKGWNTNYLYDYGGTLNWLSSYVVAYDANGGSGGPAVQMKAHGIALTLSTAEPIREGYDFLGWSEDRTATSAQYMPGGSYTVDVKTTLYAVWQLKTYEIAYDANGGSGAPAPQIKTHGIALTLTADEPEWEYHDFLGWSESRAASSARYQPGGQYTENAAATLYAVWKTNIFSVSYNANGGIHAPETQTKMRGTDLTLSSAVPSRDGYSFIGWATSADAESAEYQPGDTYSTEEDAVLCALWRLNTYEITYDANGGENAPESQFKTHGTAIKLSTVLPTRENYDFLGWALSADAQTAEYQPGSSFDADAKTTLYAVWQEIPVYTITYDANDGRGIVEEQSKIRGETLTLWMGMPTRSDYRFLGWATSADATSAEYQPGDQFFTNADTTLYAVWKSAKRAYTVDYSKGYGVNNVPESQIKYEDEDLILSSMIPTQSWAIVNCSIRLNANEGSLLNNGNSVTTMTITAGGKREYTFRYWYTSSNGSITVYYPGDVYTANKSATMYAEWRSKYVMNTITLPTPTREGYVFKFWGTSTNSESGVTGRYTPPNSNAKTFYAIWEKEETYTIVYDSKGGDGNPVSQTKKTGQTLMLSDDVPSKNGWFFLGWAENAMAAFPDYLPGGSFTKDANTTLYAVWAQPDFVMPTSLTVIDDEAFAGGAFRFVKLSETTTSIGANAFAGCSNLRYIYIPQATTNIDVNAFGDRQELTIFGYAGSDAEDFASEREGFRFVVVSRGSG